ncbi:MAG: FAD:protein FMN transferase [Prevotellaceae bacterium]|nr:FAD:protein FMN transferase [Prevotellaceae bacterium]
MNDLVDETGNAGATCTNNTNGAKLLYKSQTRFMFHSHVKIKLPAFYPDNLFDSLFAVAENFDKNYNTFSKNSFLDKINKNSGSFTDVDTQTVDLLQSVIALCNNFDGEYDITVMPLLRALGFFESEISPHRSNRRMQNSLEQSKKLVDFRRIEIRGNFVKTGKQQEIVSGSFLKGYAVDKVIAQMRAAGISDGMVNAGGSTLFALANQQHKNWQIIVNHPATNKNLFNLNIKNQCFSTSAQNIIFVENGNRKFGHIINPKTGLPSENQQVGIISNDCLTGDVFSTALMNFTGKTFLKKIKLLRQNFDIEGFMLDNDDKLFFSDGFKNYFC